MVLLLLCISAVSAALIAVEVRSLYTGPAQAARAIDEAKTLESNSAQEPEDKEHLADSEACADALKKGNLFARPAPKQNPVREVAGILGNEALINGNWYKASQKVGDAKVVAVGATEVKIEWNGQEKVFAPIAAAGSSAGGGPSRPSGPGQGSRPGRAEMIRRGRPDMPMPPPGVGARIKMMSPEERARMRESMINVSEVEAGVGGTRVRIRRIQR